MQPEAAQSAFPLDKFPLSFSDLGADLATTVPVAASATPRSSATRLFCASQGLNNHAKQAPLALTRVLLTELCRFASTVFADNLLAVLVPPSYRSLIICYLFAPELLWQIVVGIRVAVL
uniref:Uncharacterized protein n=1 Tax=Physcomitrium patens TaxID=3218 RepID=A9U3U4_PHYPA|nr:hypothetical protein PHYPA_002026 [Physcomitrium patens]